MQHRALYTRVGYGSYGITVFIYLGLYHRALVRYLPTIYTRKECTLVGFISVYRNGMYRRRCGDQTSGIPTARLLPGLTYMYLTVGMSRPSPNTNSLASFPGLGDENRTRRHDWLARRRFLTTGIQGLPNKFIRLTALGIRLTIDTPTPEYIAHNAVKREAIGCTISMNHFLVFKRRPSRPRTPHTKTWRQRGPATTKSTNKFAIVSALGIYHLMLVSGIGTRMIFAGFAWPHRGGKKVFDLPFDRRRDAEERTLVNCLFLGFQRRSRSVTPRSWYYTCDISLVVFLG